MDDRDYAEQQQRDRQREQHARVRVANLAATMRASGIPREAIIAALEHVAGKLRQAP